MTYHMMRYPLSLCYVSYSCYEYILLLYQYFLEGQFVVDIIILTDQNYYIANDT